MYRRILVGVLLTCVLQTVRCQLDPEIVDEIIPEITSQGKSAKLNCTVVNKQSSHSVIWSFKDSKTGGEVISEDETIRVENPTCKEGALKKFAVIKRRNGLRVTYMLMVNCLEFVDTGQYECYIHIAGLGSDSWPSKMAYLTVQVPPTITSKNVAVVQLDEGQNHTLECTATGTPYPNITWVRSDGRALSKDLGALHRGRFLNITNITKNDRGQYRCVADNQVRPPDEYLVEVNVFFLPEARPVQDTVGQAQNRQLKALLECQVSGYPEPAVNWFREPVNKPSAREECKDGPKFDLSKQIATTSLRFGESWYTIRIKNVEANDYTRYYCIATNRLGTNDSTVIKLFETMECQGSNCPTMRASDAPTLTISLLLAVAMATVSKIFARY